MRRCALNRDMGRRNNTTARVTTCSKRHVSAQVIHSFYLNGCSALGPTALEDYLISEQQDAHVEKSRRFAFSVQDSFLMLLSHAPKLLTVQRLWKTRTMRQTEKIYLRCLRLAQTSGTDGTKQNIPLCPPSTPTEGRVWSPYKNCAPQNRCNGKPRQHKDVKGSVTSCSLPLCKRNTKRPHTLA